MDAGRFLTVYDYGAGGVWTWIRAVTADEITRTFPDLQVVTDPPDDLDLDGIRTVDIADVDDPFLESLRTV